MKAQVWKNEALGAEWEYKDIPDDLKEISQKYRTELVETAVEQDEKLMEAYLNGDEIKEEDLVRCIRKGTLNFSFVPITQVQLLKIKVFNHYLMLQLIIYQVQLILDLLKEQSLVLKMKWK